MTVANEISKYWLDLVGVRRLEGTGVAVTQQENIYFSCGKWNIMK
jgi:hypothetical protein